MKFSICLIIACFLGSFINAQDINTRYSAEDIKQAKESGEIILFEKQTIDLGTIKKGSYPEFTYRFLNISEENIEYSFFDVCSCSILTVDEDAVIKPGEEGTFHIKFDSKEREDEEPVDVNFELKNIDKRNNYPFFYAAQYTFKFQ
jgi:hypothetical protein